MIKVKNLVLVGILGGTILLSGCGEKLQEIKQTGENIKTTIDEGKELAKQGKELASKANELSDKKDGIVGGLKNILKGGASLKCESDDGKAVTYTNGKTFRSEFTENGKKHIVIMKDGVMYDWDAEAKTGNKMKKDCFSEIQKDLNLPEKDKTVDVVNDFSVENIEKEQKEGKINCKPSTDANFEIPNDIEFADQCEIMKEQLKAMKEQIEAVKEKQSQQQKQK